MWTLAKALGTSGLRARVVSMPCWELFEEQTEAYQLEGERSALSLSGAQLAVRSLWCRQEAIDIARRNLSYFFMTTCADG